MYMCECSCPRIPAEDRRPLEQDLQMKLYMSVGNQIRAISLGLEVLVAFCVLLIFTYIHYLLPYVCTC